jgi:hypothetical protein
MAQRDSKETIPLTKNTKFVYKASTGQLIGPLVISEILEHNNFLVYLEILPQLCGVINLPDGTEIYPSVIHQHSTTAKRPKREAPTVELITSESDAEITTATSIIPTIPPQPTPGNREPTPERPQSTTTVQSVFKGLFSAGELAFL